MSIKTLPSESWRRKVLVILDQYSIERCFYENDGKNLLLNEEIHIIQFPTMEKNSIIENLKDKGLFRPGVILVQSPFTKDFYEEANIAVQQFSLEKYMIFSNFCKHLGAQEIHIEQIELTNIRGSTIFDASTGYSDIKGGVKIEREELDSFRSRLSLDDKFTGGDPDLKKAEELLHEKGLLDEPIMRSLLEIRRSPDNVIHERRLTLNLSTESKRNLKIIAKLQVPKYVSLECEYHSSIQEQKDFNITLQVVFNKEGGNFMNQKNRHF